MTPETPSLLSSGPLRRLAPLPRHSGRTASPYETSIAGRPLRILLDKPSLIHEASVRIITELAGERELDVWATVSEGLPWLDIQVEKESNDHIPIMKMRADGSIQGWSSVWPASNLRAMTKPFSQDNFRQRVAARAAYDLSFDLFITDSVYLLSSPPGVLGNVQSSPDAIRTVGLFLRSRGNFKIAAELALGSGIFYLIAVRAQLPHRLKWYSACNQSSGSKTLVTTTYTDKPTLVELGKTALERIEWAMQCRDRALWQLQREQTTVTSDETALYLESMLLQLCGAFDAIAKVTSLGFGLGLNSDPSWRNNVWLEKLRRKQPALADLMRPQTECRDILDIISLMRNTIHSAAMGRMGFQNGVQPMQNVIRLPHEGSQSLRLLDCLRRHGSDTEWGIFEVFPGELAFHPHELIVRIWPKVLSAVDAILEATPVEEFPGVTKEQLDTAEGAPGGKQPWGLWSSEVSDRVSALATV